LSALWYIWQLVAGLISQIFCLFLDNSNTSLAEIRVP
jgi:carbohydrate-binding DOMON domain-containing protein